MFKNAEEVAYFFTLLPGWPGAGAGTEDIQETLSQAAQFLPRCLLASSDPASSILDTPEKNSTDFILQDIGNLTTSSILEKM